VRQQCLDYALEHDDPVMATGIFGGKTAQQRSGLRRLQRLVSPGCVTTNVTTDRFDSSSCSAPDDGCPSNRANPTAVATEGEPVVVTLDVVWLLAGSGGHLSDEVIHCIGPNCRQDRHDGGGDQRCGDHRLTVQPMVLSQWWMVSA
jgi:hypothetical protein